MEISRNESIASIVNITARLYQEPVFYWCMTHPDEIVCSDSMLELTELPIEESAVDLKSFLNVFDEICRDRISSLFHKHGERQELWTIPCVLHVMPEIPDPRLFRGIVQYDDQGNAAWILGVVKSQENNPFLAKKGTVSADCIRSQLAISAANEGIFDLDVMAGTVFYNSRWFEMLGYQPDELPQSYETWKQLLPDDSRDEIESSIWTLIASGESWEREFPMKHKNGHWVQIEARARCVEWTLDGRPKRVIGTHSDVTRRYKAETMYRKLFDQSFSAVGLAALIHDEEGNACDFIVHEVNEAFVKQIGMSRPDIEGKRISALIGTEEGIALAEKYDAMCRQGRPVSFIYASPLLNRKWQVHGFPISDKEFVAVSNDISGESHTRQALKRSEERFRKLVDNLPQIVSFVDEQIVYRYVNKSYLRLFGGTEGDYIGRTLSDVIGRDNFLQAKVHIDRVLRGEYVRYRESFDYPDVGLRHIEGYLIPAIGENNHVRGYYAVLNDVTPYIDYQEAIRDREERLRLLTSQLPAVLWSTSRDLVIQTCSGTGLDVLNKAREACVGIPASEFLSIKGPNNPVIQSMNSAVRGGSHSLETRWGGRYWMMNFEPLSNTSGQIIGTLGLALDITESRETEKELKNTISTMESLLNLFPGMVFILDRKAHVRSANSRMLRHFGYNDMESVADMPCKEVWHGCDELCENCEIHDVLEKGESGMRLSSEKEERIFGMSFKTYTAPIFGLSNEVEGCIVLILDVSDLKSAITEREKLVAAIEQAAEIVVITDTDGIIEYVNPAFEHVTGYHRDEVIGKSPRLLKSGRQDAQFYADMWSTIKSGRIWSGRFINRKKNGEQYTEEAVISPVRDNHGNLVNFVGVKRDISHELILREQLLQSQKMEAVGKLAGGIAHDFNNILQIIVGYTDMVLKSMKEDQDGFMEISEVYAAGNRATDLVRQLLAFSRRQMLNPRNIDLNDLLDNMSKMIGRLIGEQIILGTSKCDAMCVINADPGQIEQVIMNLCVNARDAMPHGGSLFINTERVSFSDDFCREHSWALPGLWVQLQVMDTGNGMDEQVLDQIFEPFFTTKKQGTGLGLSTVYGIVAQHEGFIHVESEAEKGTVFNVFFPQSVFLPDSESPKDEAEILENPIHGTILVVEDNTMVLELVRSVIGRYGFDIYTATDGKDCLEKIRMWDTKIDLLLTDVIMPDMNGKELYEEVRKIYPEIDVIFMSGYSDGAIGEEGVLKEGENFIQKPFTVVELIKKIRQVLKD